MLNARGYKPCSAAIALPSKWLCAPGSSWQRPMGEQFAHIARQLGLNVDTVRLWRLRWLGLQAASLDDLPILERLTDAPRSGRPARISAQQTCQIVALACQAPSISGRPISHWSSREIADEVIKRGIVEQISPRHAARLVKGGISSPI